MAIELKICKLGDEIGIALSEELLAHLEVAEGDSLLLTKDAAGAAHLVSKKSEIAKQMAIFEDIADRYKNTLRELAK
jgi:putative addiction module antidote